MYVHVRACVCVCACACACSAVGVDDPVPLQVVQQDEGLAAVRAAVRPLAAVRALVHPQAALLREALAALATAVRLLARVRAVVDVEVRRALEALAAHAAPERPPPLVALLVQLELVQAAEGLAAQRADVASRGRASCPQRGSVVVVVVVMVCVGGGGGAGGGAGGMWVEAVQRESRPVGGGDGGGVPFRVFMKRMRGSGRVGHGVVLPFLRRAVCAGGGSGGLEGGCLRRRWRILLVLAAVGVLAGRLGGGLGAAAAAGLAVASRKRLRVRVVGERVGVLLHHAGEIQEAGVDIVPFDDGRPELVLSIVQREVSGVLVLFARAVLTSVPTRRRVALLLLHFDGELQVVGLLPPTLPGIV